MSTTNPYPLILESIDELRRRWRALQVLDGALRALSVAVLVLLAAVAADNLFGFGHGGRAALAIAVILATVASVLTLIVRRLLEDRRDDYFAALVERAFPELRNHLINALQLGRGDQQGASPRLIAAIIHDAATATGKLDLERGIDRRPLTLSLYGALGVGALLLLYALVLTPRFTNGLARVLAPWATIPPYTATRIDPSSIKPGDARVPEGSNLRFEVAAEGRIPAVARLVRHDAAGRSVEIDMRPKSGAAAGVYAVMVPQVGDSFDYEILAGDARSERRHVEVVKRPRLAGMALIIEPPAYTAAAPRRMPSSDGEIAALPGSRVVVEIKATKPLSAATMTTESGELVALGQAGEAATWTGSFILTTRGAKGLADATVRSLNAPARYHVRLVDRDGYENADPLWHSIDPLKDQPPTVALTVPGRDVQTEPKASLPIEVESGDDHGLAAVRIVYRINDQAEIRELVRFEHAETPPALRAADRYEWKLSSGGLKPGDLIQYWAEATDRNTITGPGTAESRRFTVFLVTPEQTLAKLDVQISDYAQMLEELARLQRENRAQTAAGAATTTLVEREGRIREGTIRLARAMEKDALPIGTMVRALNSLATGLMADAVKILETARDAAAGRDRPERERSLPVQDKIVAELEALLARLQRNEQAKAELRKIAKNDQAQHKQITETLGKMVGDLDKLLKDETRLAGKYERLPKKPTEEFQDENAKLGAELEEFRKTWEAWAKGTVNELRKLPTGFVDDFDVRPDVNRIFEEIEKAAQRAKAEKLEVPLEDLGAGLATKMKEDLEMWMPDAPDAVKWVQEEPLDQKPMKVPEMTLPKSLEDLVGDLLQEAEEFDKDADDVTSAWGDNLDQAGWGVSDGPISSFSAKGKTGNDLPNSQEVTGRSGDGRRGKSSGQMVGDTARALPGRKTPTRVGAERYEPGRLKQEAQDDPNGATGGGKKAGAGRTGLQGGTPPDFVKDIGRLTEKQAGLRTKAEEVARKLEAAGVSSRRLNDGIAVMKSAEQDLRELRYQDAARKRRTAIGALRSGLSDLDGSTAASLSRARDLPPQLRDELRQAADEAYPAGYESLLKSYYKALSTQEPR